MNLPSPQFQAIEEQDKFLTLFPHRYDYIYAEHPEPSDSPEWKTESRHPLSDRQIQQGPHLHGVRFGKQTHYLVLDIDSGSPYHPHRDPFAIHRLKAALEPLGLTEIVVVTSSYRNGLHIYLIFQNAQVTWKIAQVVSTLLTTAGFKLKAGQLELFPNPRPYSESPSLYAAHRLPLQAGSYLLNSDFQPVYSDQNTFVQRWTYAQSRNEIDPRVLERVLQQGKRKRHKLSGKAEKFLNDLNTEIEVGWTSAGQTNHLLGRIAMREYIFGHIQRGSEPLTGENLADAICQAARSVPGFKEYCNHQANLEQRAILYARSIQASHYYPFGFKNQAKASPPETTTSEPVTPASPTWNQHQAQAARDRIQRAVSDLLSQHALPVQPTARKHAIKAYGISSCTLDKYKELWHPNHLKPIQGKEDHPIQVESAPLEVLKPIQEEEDHPVSTNKLVPTPAAPQGQAAGVHKAGGSGGFSTAISEMMALKEQLSTTAEKHIAKMQEWLESNDPILVAEAQQFFTTQNQTIQNQKEWVVLAQLDEVESEQPSDCLSKGTPMPGGFGVTQPKRRTSKTSLKEIVQLGDALQKQSQALQSDLAIQADVEVSFAQYQQEHPEELALAWSAGVYNPLAGMEDTHARMLTLEEDEWLGLSKAVGWLIVEDELDAVYFTALPPSFALEQADLYLRPDLTTFLEEPMLLREVVHLYPVSLEVIQGAIAQRVEQLGWTPQQRAKFILEVLEKPELDLEPEDWEALLFELPLQNG